MIREHRQTEESILRDDTRGDQIADDMFLAEVAKQIGEATALLKKSNDEAEKHD